MTQITVITRFGRVVAQPFAIAKVEEDPLIPEGEVQEQNKDTEAPENIAED